MIISILANGKVYQSPNARIAGCVTAFASEHSKPHRNVKYLHIYYLERSRQISIEQNMHRRFSSMGGNGKDQNKLIKIIIEKLNIGG